MQDFRKLLVWQKAHELALFTYRITNGFPRDEIFGLRNMMRKVSIDIPGFIAEGCGKGSRGEFIRSLEGAIALSNRLEYYGIMSRDLTFLDDETFGEFERRLVEVRRMTSGFSGKLASQ
jgi:four helix bundle protein